MYPYLWGMHGASYVALPLMDLVGNAAAWPVRKILEHTPAE